MNYSTDYNWLYDFIIKNQGTEITGKINPNMYNSFIDPTTEIEIKIGAFDNIISFGDISCNIKSSKDFFIKDLCEKFNLKFIKL